MKKDVAIIEVSYEVVNKVGGIYTVVSSKSGLMQKKFREYYCIGPYYRDQAEKRFEETPVPERFKKAVELTQKELGVKIHYGKWIIPSEPETFLIEFQPAMNKTNDIKFYLWKDFGVDSLGAGGDFDEPVVWAHCAGVLIQKMKEVHCFDVPLIAQCHEWLSGPCLLHLKKSKTDVKTVFTTHATMLGRSIAGGGGDLLSVIDQCKHKKINPDELATKYRVQAKHLTEKASAHHADAFTTVSKTTGEEAEGLHGKKPDVLTYNGLNMDEFPLMEEVSAQHIRLRGKLRKFAFDYFFPHYNIDVHQTLFVYLSGRHEIANKGIDVFIDSLGKLNNQLKKDNKETTLIAIVLVPYSNNGRNLQMLKRMALFEQLEETIDAQLPMIKERVWDAIGTGKDVGKANLLDKEFLFNVRAINTRVKARPEELPPWSPFELVENEVTNMLRKNQLFNRPEDRVKIIYYPDYVSKTDGVLGMDYNEIVAACHLGVFPSNYEPWGYTPVETAALGLPTITTDMAGYGQWVLENVKKAKRDSVMVLKRRGKTYEQIVGDLSDMLAKFYYATKKQRNQAKIEAKKISDMTDWKKLIDHYATAYEIALKK